MDIEFNIECLSDVSESNSSIPIPVEFCLAIKLLSSCRC